MTADPDGRWPTTGPGSTASRPTTGVRTVAGELAGALGRYLGHEVELTVAGRTDAGVHARGQVVTFDAGADVAELDLEALVRSVNHQCGPAIAVREAEVVPPEFDARFSAAVAPLPLPGAEPAAPRPVPRGHVVARRAAPRPLGDGPGLRPVHRRARLRRVLPPAEAPGRVGGVARAPGEARRRWADDGDGLLRFEIEASSFCHQMVRSIVGTMVAVGHGRLRAGDVAGIIRSRRPLEGRRPRPAPGPHPVVGPLRRLVQLTERTADGLQAMRSTVWPSARRRSTATSR